MGGTNAITAISAVARAEQTSVPKMPEGKTSKQPIEPVADTGKAALELIQQATSGARVGIGASVDIIT